MTPQNGVGTPAREGSGSQCGRYRPPGVNWTIQEVDK